MSMPSTSHSVTTSTPRLMAKIERPSVRSAIGAVTNLSRRPAVALITMYTRAEIRIDQVLLPSTPGTTSTTSSKATTSAISLTAVFFSTGDPL